MATMLRSAAMTLLSKTLLTFLYKYLSDVDVEGVEMPSLYAGQSSGWGVRLSNVKLREGAELMVLPGKKEKEKEKPTKSSTKEPRGGGGGGGGGDGNSTVSSSKDAAPKPGRRKLKKNGNKITLAARRDERSTEDPGDYRRQNGEPNIDTATMDDSKIQKDAANALQGTSFDTISTGILANELKDDILDSDCESLSSLPEGSTSRPETPTQNSSIGFFHCFANGQADAAAKASMTEQREQETHFSSETPSQEEREQGESRQQQHSKGINGFHHHPNMNGEAATTDGDYNETEMDAKELCDEIQKGIDEQLPEIPDILDEEDYDDEEEDHAFEEEEEEDHVPQSPPMALRIGEGGYIGTLDVRLVGRELHVLVEDAFLCVEAVTKEATEEEPDPAKNSTDAESTTTDALAGEATEKPPTSANPPSAPVDIDDLKTTGERVLAKNAIARIFSSIPHLFLRDIVVRLIVRGDDNIESDASEADSESKDAEASVEDNGETDIDSADVIVDIGIGLLSVTEGDEFVSPFSEAAEDDASIQEGEEEVPPPPSMNAQSSQTGASPENAYLNRRIRTGKGSDGGLWLNIFTPKYENASRHSFANYNHERVSHAMENRWARHSWLESTRNCVLRISGLDIQARIFLGTKKELGQANSSSLWSYEDGSTYAGIDHTLYGFDHVVPGPTPNTLPPLAPAPHCSASRSQDEGDDNGNLRSQLYKTDRNGIQSSQIESCFYRVARGMTPTRCTTEHLPCENCLKCWEVSGIRTHEPLPEEAHILDSYTPMPGLALSVMLKDPLELNVDRVSLEGLGLVIGLFKKKKETSDREPAVGEPQADEESEEAKDTPPVDEVVPEPESQGYFSSFFFGSSKPDEGEKKGRRFSDLLSPRRRKAKPPAFPPYMKPENINILGVFIAEVRLRVHVMREDDQQRHNTGLSFCYWDLKGDCVTLDQQKLTAKNKSFNDIRLDVGILQLNEFKGTDKRILLFTGVPLPTKDSELLSLDSFSSIRGRGARPPWPTFASALLDVPATLESMVFENRERHGLQLRLLSVTDQPETDYEKSRALINCQLGALELTLPMKIGGLIGEIKGEAMKSLGFMKNEEDPNADEPDPEETKKKDSATQYRAQVGGGRVRMTPSIDVRLPLTRLAGNICPESGFSMETLLERVELCYGQDSKKLAPTANSARGVSLRRFAGLPEAIRLRILLFLDDLEPLEKALGVRRMANSFLRCNAVNKGLGKIAAKRTKKKAVDSSHNKLNRRQELMNKLLTLDDEALESLWLSHQRKQRKVKKTNSNRKLNQKMSR